MDSRHCAQVFFFYLSPPFVYFVRWFGPRKERGPHIVKNRFFHSQHAQKPPRTPRRDLECIRFHAITAEIEKKNRAGRGSTEKGGMSKLNTLTSNSESRPFFLRDDAVISESLVPSPRSAVHPLEFYFTDALTSAHTMQQRSWEERPKRPERWKYQ